MPYGRARFLRLAYGSCFPTPSRYVVDCVREYLGVDDAISDHGDQLGSFHIESTTFERSSTHEMVEMIETREQEERERLLHAIKLVR